MNLIDGTKGNMGGYGSIYSHTSKTYSEISGPSDPNIQYEKSVKPSVKRKIDESIEESSGKTQKTQVPVFKVLITGFQEIINALDPSAYENFINNAIITSELYKESQKSENNLNNLCDEQAKEKLALRQKIESAEMQIASCHAYIAKVEKDSHAANYKNRQLQDENYRLNQTKVALEKEVVKSQKETQSLQTCVRDLQNEKTVQWKEFNKEKEKAAAQERALKDEITRIIAILRSDREEADDKTTELASRIYDLEIQIRKKKAELEAQSKCEKERQVSTSATIERVSQEKSKLELERENLRNQFEKEKQDFTKSLSEATKVNSETTRLLEMERQQKSESQSQNQLLLKQLKELEAVRKKQEKYDKQVLELQNVTTDEDLMRWIEQ